MGRFRWNMEGKRVCCSVASLFCKGCKLVGTHKKHALALFFFVVEAVSVVLDLIGKNKEVFLLAALLLSAFGFAVTLYVCVEEKTSTMAERQLKVVEFVFSVIQLVITFIQFLLTILKVKNSYNTSAFPLAFAMIAVIFIFKKGGNMPREFHLPLVNLQPIDSHHVPNSTPSELLDLTRTSSPNQEDSSEVPSYFLCPIFQDVMVDPHVGADGFSYELEAIEAWLDSGHDTSPMTNLRLKHKILTPNHTLRSLIMEYRKNQWQIHIQQSKVMADPSFPALA
ncbi:hypothetical protein ACOSQ4_003978 [Xanthoceras sorbifolium]